MKPTFIARLLGALLLSVALAGCRNEAEQTTPPPATGQPSASMPSSGTASTPASDLGTEQAAGPFKVTLSKDTATSPAGEAHFQAKVSQDGKPVSTATLTLDLSMPSMKMAGPKVTLKPAGDHYEGSASLGMAGDWEAKLSVSSGGNSGTATYHFSSQP